MKRLWALALHAHPRVRMRSLRVAHRSGLSQRTRKLGARWYIKVATSSPKALSSAVGLQLLSGLLSLGHAVDVPPFRARVNDYARMLNAREAQEIEERLRRFEEETNHQIAVLTIPTLQGDDLQDFSIRVAETWKIGHRGHDNGVILLVVRDDRKIRIEVGYGLEGVLPDATAYRIIQDVILPRFRERDFLRGIESGVSAIIQTVRGESILPAPRAEKGPGYTFVSTMLLLFAGTALFGSVLGFAQPCLARGAASGAFVSAVVGLPAISAVGPAIWLVAICVGALASMFTIQFTRRAWGRSWSVRPSVHGGYSPRDIFRTGYSGGRTGGYGGRGSGATSSGRFSGGGGGFGGGGASGSW